MPFTEEHKKLLETCSKEEKEVVPVSDVPTLQVGVWDNIVTYAANKELITRYEFKEISGAISSRYMPVASGMVIAKMCHQTGRIDYQIVESVRSFAVLRHVQVGFIDLLHGSKGVHKIKNELQSQRNMISDTHDFDR